MRVEKWWNEICDRGKREKPREKPTQTPFRPPQNPHGGTETRTRNPSGGRRAPDRLRHEAAFYFHILGFIIVSFFLLLHDFCPTTGIFSLQYIMA